MVEPLSSSRMDSKAMSTSHVRVHRVRRDLPWSRDNRRQVIQSLARTILTGSQDEQGPRIFHPADDLIPSLPLLATDSVLESTTSGAATITSSGV